VADAPTTSGGRRGTIAAAATAVTLALAGMFLVVTGLRTGGEPAQPPLSAAVATRTPATVPAPAASADQATVATPPPAPAQELDVPTMARSNPVALEIPSIGVNSTSLVDLGKNPDGSLEVPRDFAQPGWFSPGPAPGQFGPAVIAGHVDSRKGPAVFYRLGELRPGAVVRVARADGTTAVFRVDKVERYPKNRFPTVAVYGDNTHRSELRLITCGGQFDSSTGHYVDNVVAYAHLL